MCGHACGLQLSADNPASYLVKKGRLNAAMQRADPALEVLARLPYAYYIVSILMKLHLQPVRVGRTAGKAIISLLFQPDKRILYLFHVRN
jgi:hypothetical protein